MLETFGHWARLAPTAFATGATKPTMNENWIVSAEWENRTLQPITSFVTTFEVPPEPTQKEYQTIFLFSSLMLHPPRRLAYPNSILQPVLQWGVSGAGGGNYWSLLSWYVGAEGALRYTYPLVKVEVGQKVVARITGARQATGFDYLCEFEGYPDTQLALANHLELRFATVTLEAFGIHGCASYPAARKTAFTGIGLQTANIPAALDWQSDEQVTDCGQKVVVVKSASQGGEIELYYRG